MTAVSSAQGQVEPAAFTAAWADGRALGLERAVAEARAVIATVRDAPVT